MAFKKKTREVIDVTPKEEGDVPKSPIPPAPTPQEAKYNSELAQIAAMSHTQLVHEHLTHQVEMVVLLERVLKVLERIEKEEDDEDK